MSITNRIIALSGWRNSGKDATADFLVNEYGYTKVSFAAALKDLVAEQYGLPRSALDDRVLKEAPLLQLPAIPTDRFSQTIHQMLESELRSGYWTPRALCILEGSIKRSVNSNYWVSRVVNQFEPGKRYVISDMRYKSEADTLQVLLEPTELLTVRINRFTEIDTNEASERDLDDYKFALTIGNNGDIQQLHRTLGWAFAGVFGEVPK
jgi:hypothetical protein